MSEAKRSRFYDWLREQTDEPLAEYVMSCLSPAPLPELATKADFRRLEDIVVRLDAKFEADRAERIAQREADRAEFAAQREADRAELAAQREADRAEFAALRDTDRAERDLRLDDVLADSQQRFRWLVGLGATGFAVMLASMFALAAITQSVAG